MNNITKFHVKNKLRQARARISKIGWTQNTWSNENHCACALGAIRISCGLLSEYGAPYRDYNQQEYDLAERTEDHFKKINGISNVISWNDVTTRTKEEVLAAFDKAIAA